VIEDAFNRAGFAEIDVRRIDAPLRMASAVGCVRFERESFGAFHQMMVGLTDSERADAWNEIEQELSSFETSDGFEGPCELIIAVGTAS
jgi:hypothetical protein